MTSLLLAGDVMLGRGVSQAMQRMHPDEPWGDLLPLFQSADFRLINLESPITGTTKPSPFRKLDHFRAEPIPALLALRSARINACSLGNNHILDYESPGLLDTVQYLENERIKYAGAGTDMKKARAPAFVDLGPGRGKIAVLSLTDQDPIAPVHESEPGVNYFPIDLDASSLAWLDRSIDESREKGASLVILSLHWGSTMTERPPSAFQRFAHAAIERGVDVIHGHGAHIFQGVEVFRGKPIFYDCGDLIDDYGVNPVLRNDWSFLFMLDFDENRLRNLKLVPVQLGYGRARLAREPERELIMNRMISLSREFGTNLQPQGEFLVLRSAAAKAA
ncbi:MAG: hypothetical protein A2X94_10015 [Bdellovibrionales bacterium GWB1_55_8]|nr:MAG: hypothetical protein A2X94_10015 [Bdellovibrionales bacterium GWB1_55_8]